MQKTLFAITLPLAALIAACSADRPCTLCYEDEWSREPFPGQPKQHIPTVDMRTEQPLPAHD